MLGLSGRCRCSLWLSLLLSVGCVLLFCEFGIYYPAILRCSWPRMEKNGEDSSSALRALFLSDTHLLGAIRGHWFDKLRREWQMERAFQTAMWLLRPEIVFILGDVFDEGKWSSPKNWMVTIGGLQAVIPLIFNRVQVTRTFTFFSFSHCVDWEDDVRRFKQIFRHPSDTELVVLIGNHDIGFHHEMTRDKLERFEKVFNVTSARILTKKGVNFLLVNSVALHGDHCPICQGVENELHSLSQALNCSVKSLLSGSMRHRCRDMQTYASTPPIILQHYPLYRASDAECTGEDAAPPNERYQLFHERYDVLSQDASKMLLWWFHPRLILSGHTHSGCEVLHENGIPEISVPSFSWRNRNNPSFILGSFSESDYALSKCFLPEESSVIAVYFGSAMALMLITLGHLSLFRGALHTANILLGKQKSV